MKKLLFTLTFIIMALTVYAQAYDFSYANYENTHTCTTKFFTIEDRQMRLNLTSTDSSRDIASCMVSFEFIICNGLEKDNVSIQIKLSNGDILNCKDVQKQNSLLTIMYLLPVTIIDKNTDKDEDGYYIMSLLRTYNIVSLTIGETTINTPNMRSADTFDAMCKTLISKTGDQGQYGKRLTGGSTTSQKPQTPSTSKPSTNRTQQNTPKPNTTNSQTSSNSVDLSKANATTLKAEAEKGNHEAMYILGCRYHDGQLPGIEKNDRLSYQWLMTYYHFSGWDNGKKVMDYIKNNFQTTNSQIMASNDYLTKEKDLNTMDFILHPLAFFPTCTYNMKEEKMEQEIESRRKWIIYTTSKKKYDKNVIRIKLEENKGKMPVLYGKEVSEMYWSNASKRQKVHCDHQFKFVFDNRQEAEKFLYTITYETMREGAFYKKTTETPCKKDDDISLSSVSKIVINNFPYDSIVIDLWMHKNNYNKSYTVTLSTAIIL